jgi:hypothetical protein
MSPLGMEQSMSDERRRRHFIAGLRAVAEFYEQNADAYYDGMRITLNMYVWGVAARQTLRQMARALAPCNKVYDDHNVTVSRQFSEQITLAVFAPRAKVCRRVVTGTRILPARIVPATNEIRIPPASMEIVEWQCDPLLHGDAPS